MWLLSAGLPQAPLAGQRVHAPRLLQTADEERRRHPDALQGRAHDR